MLSTFEESELEELKASAARTYKERYLYLKKLQSIIKTNTPSIDVDDIDTNYIELKRKDAN
ncbi:hypothetical protein QWY31_09575 [Cytophagales bacterium LB-30]|uniref:Uncharacterized protein n=1 Tax=Shiella aurantiaca TaxID=3058365 RepID=A0ABT8F5P9_9BACT|nr:hypothetical protein [Shiella aurantiaca]MDN4165752.1 hypothetical protein [Shiella aurantiaca]